EVERLIADVGQTSAQLRETGELTSGDLPVLLPPRVASEFIGTYVIRNLSGSLVSNRQSKYTLDDFKGQQQVIRPDLLIEVNPLVPWELTTEPCTGEGVPASIVSVVDDGRLLRPLCDLKYA